MVKLEERSGDKWRTGLLCMCGGGTGAAESNFFEDTASAGKKNTADGEHERRQLQQADDATAEQRRLGDSRSLSLRMATCAMMQLRDLPSSMWWKSTHGPVSPPALARGRVKPPVAAGLVKVDFAVREKWPRGLRESDSNHRRESSSPGRREYWLNGEPT